MDYEKKYKEALKVMEDLYNVVRYQSSTDALLASQTIEKAFPELKESEDERIRKEIISFITDRKNWFPKEETKDSWIAWLERQPKEQPHWRPSEEQMEALFNARLVSTRKREYFLGLLYEDLKKL